MWPLCAILNADFSSGKGWAQHIQKMYEIRKEAHIIKRQPSVTDKDRGTLLTISNKNHILLKKKKNTRATTFIGISKTFFKLLYAL